MNIFKSSLLVFLFGLSIIHCSAQSFVKREIPKSRIVGLGIYDNGVKDKMAYKITAYNDSSDAAIMSSRIRINNLDNIDTLSLIYDLLSFEGDISICALPIMCYNPHNSDIYMGNSRCYSIQLEALFMINQLYLDEPFYYSPYPVIMDIQSGKDETIDGVLVEKAFKAYKEWFEEIKELGLNAARKENLRPFDNTNLIWYSSSLI